MIPRSLRARVTTVGVVTLGLVLSVGGWLTVRALAAALRSDTTAQNEEVLDDLAQQVSDGVDPRVIRLPIGGDGTEFLILDEQENLLNFSFPTTDSPFLVEGPVTATEVIPVEGDLASESELIAFILAQESDLPGGGSVVFEDVGAEVSFGTLGNWFETRRTIDTPTGDQLTLVAITPFEVLDRSIDRLALALAVIVPLIVLLGGLALWFALGSALQPVQRITDEAKRIAPSNSGDRLPVPDSSDEIADLTLTLNNMLDRLDAGLVRQRQFVSDASHELRSPLTAVKGAAELVAVNQDLPESVEPTVEALSHGVTRLETVLDDLTELAVAGVTLPRSEVELADVINAEAAAVAREADVPIETDGVTPVVVSAHQVRLGRAVRNLLENAVRHAEGKVMVVGSVDDGWVRITVDDDGPGIPEADRYRVFERFVRLDDGRARAGGGSGLGLALVAAIAAEHDGTVNCTTSPIGGSRFELRFPATIGTG